MYYLKLVLICLGFSITAFAQKGQARIQYLLNYGGTYIKVQMLYRPFEKDSTTFSYGNLAYGGQTDIMKGLQNLRVGKGARLSLDTLNRTIHLYFKKQKAISINYDIVDTRILDNTRSQLFRPMITPDYFFVHGINLFLSPHFRSDSSNYKVAVEWKKLPGFKLFYTFDPENDGTRPTITTQDSLEYRFMTGANDLVVRKFSSESGENYLVIRSNSITPSIEQELKDFYLNFNSSMRDFWNDNRIIKYALVLQPYLHVNHDISGVSYGNGFIGKYNHPDSLAKGERRSVIAHEIGHYYMSDLEAFAGDNKEGQWFDEGFNDYLAYFNLIRSKNMQADEFESVFNEIFKNLYSSRIKNTPNNKIFENFWKLGDYAKLPYWRGAIYAFYLDNQISLITKDKSNLRNLVLDLKQIVKAEGKIMFTNEQFLNALENYLPGEETKKGFESFILKGISIPFDHSMLLPFFQISIKEQTPILKIVDQKKFLEHFENK